jgi:signal transduction histidine kinase
MLVLLGSLTVTTVRPCFPHFVWSAGDLGVCRAGDLRRPISAARQMKSGRVRDTVVLVTRLPKGEKLDRIVAAALVVLGQIELWVGDAIPGPKPLAVAAAIVIAGSVAVRRRRPLAVGSVVLVTNAVMIVVAEGSGSSVALAVAWMCSLYAIAVWTDTRGFVAGLGVLVCSNALTLLPPPLDGLRDAWLFTVIPVVAMVLVRGAVRGRQLRAEALAARAELLEREHELRAHEAVAEERARIARELHDLVAHSVSVMVIQAGVERHALPDDQAATREAFASIEQAGRQALVEARRLLGMLRRDGDREELEPQPSIDELDVLVEQVQRAGLGVRLEIEGEAVPLPAGVDLCAYRIIQEGLTNTLKHAGPAHAQVLLRYAPRSFDVEIRDDGTGDSQNGGDGSGHGLIGMRERVALYGGTLRAGPRERGGFEIRARLPLE